MPYFVCCQVVFPVSEYSERKTENCDCSLPCTSRQSNILQHVCLAGSSPCVYIVCYVLVIFYDKAEIKLDERKY